jgi:predicted phosphodiesterase
MRALVLGDIHGNLPALEKLFFLEKDNYDVIICHGDVVNYAPWSNECVQLLDTFKNIVLLKGNHETNYLKKIYSGTNVVAKIFFDTCFLEFKEFEKIGMYKEEYMIGDFIVKHTFNNNYIYPDTDLSAFNIKKNYIIGHSHYAFNRFINGCNVINTGSLGQNRVHVNESNYVLYDLEKKEIKLKSFTHNIDLVINEMQARNYPTLCLEYYKNKKRV